jgi:hypothetical protein
MRESAAVLSGQDAKKSTASRVSTAPKVDAQKHWEEPLEDLGPLRERLLKLRRNGGRPSVERISAELAGMTAKEMASTLQALQQTLGNRFVQMVVSQAALRSQGKPSTVGIGSYEQSHEAGIGRKLKEAQGGVQTMEPDVRSAMQSSFGQDLGEVRLHTDARANALARSLNAQAFTVGQDVFFASGKYQPKTQKGKSLLAHELAHTRQQLYAPSIQRSPDGTEYSISRSGLLEREARHAASRVAAGLTAGKLTFSSAPKEMAVALLQTEDADLAQIDPEELQAEILASLKSDPDDRSGKARQLMAGLDPASRAAVLGRIRPQVKPSILLRLSKSLLPEAPAAKEKERQPPAKTMESKGRKDLLSEANPAAAKNLPAGTEIKKEMAKLAEVKGAMAEPTKKEASKAAVGAGLSAGAVAQAKTASLQAAPVQVLSSPATSQKPPPQEISPEQEASKQVASKQLAPQKAAAQEAAPAQAAPLEAEAPSGAAPSKPAMKPEEAVAAKGPAGEKEAEANEVAPAVSPESNPDFQAVVKKTGEVASKAGSHAPAAVKSAEAQAAAVGPSNEVSSKAAAGQVQAMSQAQPKPFDRAAFKAALMQKIASITPKNLEEADKFKGSGKAASLKADLTSQVERSKEQSQGDVKEKVEQEPDRTSIEPKPVTPLPPAEAGAAPSSVNAAQASPKPAPPSEVSLQQGSSELDAKMSGSGVTDEQLEKSNEPSFKSALGAKNSAKQDAVDRPKEFRKEEQAEIAQAKSEMMASEKAELTAMHLGRSQQVAKVEGLQVNAKGKDEQERAKVSDHIQEIYNQTKAKVEARLKRLDDEVNSAFDKGAAEASSSFEEYVGKKMKDYKDERYSGAGGAILWASDKLFGMPEEVNRFYEEGRDLCTSKMDAVIDSIAALVESGLNESREEIANGKKQVEEYVNSQPAALRSVAEEAAGAIQSRFEELENSVNEKQNQLIDSLAKKYVESSQRIDARIQQMKAENKGLVDAAMEALSGVIETILKMKNMLLSTLARAASAIELIIADPIKFLGNLVAGVKQGLSNFLGKIGHYLMQGLLAWLFGALAEAGISLPESFDLKGILSLVLQVLGLTYANIRARAVKIVGERVVGALEKTAGIIYDVITKGPGVLWDWIKDKLGDLKSMILEPIKSFVQEKIIMAGITWLLGLLNPAGAFIKAVKAIYDIIMFFVERCSQIMALVNAVIDSVTAIAVGNISVAANLVEKALASAVPVVIGFLAALLGLGGISEKIKSVIEAIRAPINKAIDWVVGKAIELFKAAGKLLGFGEAKPKDEIKKGTTSEEMDLDATIGVDGERHRIWIEPSGERSQLMAASVPGPFSAFFGSLEKLAGEIETQNRKNIEEEKGVVLKDEMRDIWSNFHQIKRLYGHMGTFKPGDPQIKEPFRRLISLIDAFISLINDARNRLNIGKGIKGGNLVKASYHISLKGTIRSDQLIGLSIKEKEKALEGEAERARLAEGLVKIPEERLFETFEVDGYTREYDAEDLVLEEIANRLLHDTNAKPIDGKYPQFYGTIILISQKRICLSCGGVIQQFRRMFPKVKLIAEAKGQ